MNKGLNCKIKYVKLRHSFYFNKVIFVRMFQYLTFLNNVAPTAQKMKFTIKDLVTFTEEILLAMFSGIVKMKHLPEMN